MELEPISLRDLELRRVPVTLTEPVRAAHGVHAQRHVVLVRVNNGWGECGAPDDPGYTGETADAAAGALEQLLLPFLRSLSAPITAHGFRSLLAETIPDALVRFPMAVAALEMAVLDAQLRDADIAFNTSFATPAKPVATAGATLGNTGSLDHLVRQAAHAADAGYARLKVKISPGFDIDVIRAIRSVAGDDVLLLADANGSYSSADLQHVASLHELGLDIIEQPFADHDTVSHQGLVATGTLRVALDEGVRSPDDALGAVLNHECTDLTLKPARFGYPACVSLLDECHNQGVDSWIGGMFDTGVARWANARLATHVGVTLPSDIGASERYWQSDITVPVTVEHGLVANGELTDVGLSGVPVL